MSGKEIFYVVILETRCIAHIMYRNGLIAVSLRLYKEPLLKGFLSLQIQKGVLDKREGHGFCYVRMAQV
jgi:hypothetical protein